ncbi:MAG: AAA-like domain-containing protein, partial [Scytolyngbya sp. HA4215-MV1]|nr:AAA-like domain-containing protein [Scytolyngbya sp. HA4215-MV1]
MSDLPPSTDRPSTPYDYQSEGGALRVDAPTYVLRKADGELLDGLKAGRLCYVLNARQMGKSSLKVRTIERLQAEGIACAAIDLQGIGTSVSQEQWYVSLINRLVRSLGLRRQFQLNDWWAEHQLLSEVQRLGLFFETVLLPAIATPIVLLFDEIDLTRSLPFSADDFFGLLRECYNRRANEPEFRRLSFALFGVATPSDLIRNKDITPFNIGQPVDLTGFELADAAPLLPGLVAKSADAQALLAAVLHWSGGQPFLTQRLCRLVQRAESVPLPGQEAAWVAQLVQAQVIENWEAQDIPPHLQTIRDRLLLGSQEQAGRLLGLYQRVLDPHPPAPSPGGEGEPESPSPGDDPPQPPLTRGEPDLSPSPNGRGVGGEGIAADDSPEQLMLRLTGLVVRRAGRLRVYNPIYAGVFNQAWVAKALGELRPYGAAIAVWLASGQTDESVLLRGQTLEKARQWARDKSLADDDRRFLDASLALEGRLGEEERAILAAATQKAQQRVRIGAMVLGLMLLGTAASALVARQSLSSARQAAQREQDANQRAQNANQKATQSLQQALRLQQEFETVNSKRNKAESAARKARQDWRTAQRQAAQAKRQYQQAQQQLGQAKTQLTQVNQTKNQAEAAKIEAQQREKAANEQTKTARNNLEAAQRTLETANQNLKLAQTGTQLEQQGSAALRQFDTNQTAALLLALETGQTLQNLVQQKANAKGAVLVNHKLALTEYPAISPLAALHQILLYMIERPVPTRQGIVRSVSWTADGKTLATGGSDGSVKLWNRDGTPITTLNANQSIVRSVSWTADGKTLATGGDDGSVKLWNRDGTPITTLNANQSIVR